MDKNVKKTNENVKNGEKRTKTVTSGRKCKKTCEKEKGKDKKYFNSTKNSFEKKMKEVLQ